MAFLENQEYHFCFMHTLLPTAREGNVFTPVCLFTGGADPRSEGILPPPRQTPGSDT